MVLVLIGVHMAPNRVLTGSPGRELQGGADYRVGLVPDIQKCTKIFGDPAGPGRVLAGFSIFFRNGPGRPLDYYLGVGGGVMVLWGGGIVYRSGLLSLGPFLSTRPVCLSVLAPAISPWLLF